MIHRHVVPPGIEPGTQGWIFTPNPLLCQQIQNLKTEVSGITLKEKRKSKAIQRDDWSATKYGLRFAQILETLIKKTEYQAKSSWAAEIEKYKNGGFAGAPQASGTRANLLTLRKR